MKKYLIFCLTIFVSISAVAKGKDTKLNEYTNCGLNKKAIQLAQLLIEAQGQKRVRLTCNESLSKIAREKAIIMANSEIVSHNLDNLTPNELLKNGGILLPLYYEKIGNQVESVLGGIQTAQETFDLFMTSEPHKRHLLGQNELYQGQTEIGVGYYFDKKKKHMDYWVVYITALKNVDEEYSVGMNLKIDNSKPVFSKKQKRMEIANDFIL